MTDYYYYDDPDSDTGHVAVPVDDVVTAMRRIAQRGGIKFSDEDILRELGLQKKHTSKRTGEAKKKNTRVFLYVDGTNFFAGQNDLFGPSFYLPFGEFLRIARQIRPITHIRFYASFLGPKRKKKSGIAYTPAVEAAFYRSVKETSSLIFYKGHRSPTSNKEKGVDVHLSVDMVRDAFLKRYDEAVIISGDADLSYAVEVARRFSVPVHALFLPNRFSIGISYAATSSVVINYQKRFSLKDLTRYPKSLRVLPIKDPACKQAG